MSDTGQLEQKLLKASSPSAEGARMKTKLFRAMTAVAMLALVLQAFGAAIKW